MRLSAGNKLGPYEITGLIGKGGMGEVYRANDTRLNRPVAIKVSSREFSDRFEREAQAISALNHPNICTLYDIGPNYLVMEFVEGEMLSKIIERGPLPLDKALAYAVQIIDALDAAHTKGVIHRDLKPGNIIVTKNGVKVLDFGLARLVSERMPRASADSDMETVTEPITRAGAVLGTLYYMSPEQVEAKETDERSDIFSFGVVVYEMITGQRPFQGDTQAAVLASLMKDQPAPMNQRQPAVPRALERVVRKCLEKKPEDRWRSAHDLKPTLELIDLDAPSMGNSTGSVPIPTQTPSRQRWLWPALSAVALLAAAGFFYLRPKAAPPAEAVRFEIGQPENATLSNALAISPDGRRLAFIASIPGQPGSAQIWVRTLETLESRPLEGTSGVGGTPFWSSDSKSLTFSAQGKLKKIDASGGPAQTLADVPALVAGGFWTGDNRIVFSVLQHGLFQVPSLGGTPTPLNIGSIEELGAVTPSPLPNGRDFVYCQCSSGGGIVVANLDGGSQPKKLLPDNSSAVVYAPSPNSKLGYVLFSRGASQLSNGTLMAQPIDPSTLELAGDAFPLAEQVAFTGFSASATGVLVYQAGGTALPVNNPGLVQGQMTWFDRQGKVISTVGEPGVYRIPKLSPDGSRVAIETLDVQSKNADIWLFEFARGTNTRFTFGPDADMKALWSRDGKHILYGTASNPAMWYRRSADGTGDPEAIFKPGEVSLPASWSPDGRFVLYNGTTAPADIKGVDISTGSVADRKPFSVVTSEFNDIDPRFSPDGKWFAYASNESGKPEIYVRPFNPPSSGTSASGGGKWMVSKGGGTGGAVWRGDGKELFFFSPDKTVMRVEVTTNPVFSAGVPEPLFKASQGVLYFDASPDGKRFLMPVAAGAATLPYKVVLNWTSTVKK